MLKYKYKTADEVPEEHKALYKEVELTGANNQKEKWFVLQVEGAVDNDRFKEFRTNNTKLFEENKALKEKYEGIEDPETAKKLLELAKGVDEDELKNVLKKGGVERQVEIRTKAMGAEYEKKLKAEQEKAAKLEARLQELEINNVVVAEGTKRGLVPSATLDIGARARQVFKLKDGKPVAYEADGTTQRFNAAGNPLSIAEWVESQVTEAPHLFGQSAGSGAGGSGSGGAGNLNGGVNPWKDETWNLTQQFKIEKANPDLAKKLAAQAGKKL